MQKAILGIVVTGLLGLVPAGLAQEAGPASQPTTHPTTRERKVLVMPPGFALVEASGFKALCEEADRPWVLQTLQAYKPATRPTTMPLELVDRFAQQRQGVVDRMCQDLSVKDPTAIQKRMDETIVDELSRLRDFRPPVFYMVTTKDRLKALLRTGEWQHTSFYYNQIADDVFFRDAVLLKTDGPMDDAILAFVYLPKLDVTKRSEQLGRMIEGSQKQMTEMVSGRAMFTVQMALAETMMKDVFAPLKLRDDQAWLSVGLAGALSTEYAAPVMGSPKNELLLMLVAEIRQNPIKMRTISLLDPAPAGTLKPAYVAAYADSYRRKSVSAALKILESGRAKLPDLVSSLREKPCGNGDELVTRVKEITGVDVSGDVGAR